MTNPFGRAMAQMCAIFAELERSMIRERTRSAMGVKRSRGQRISRHAPFGWDFGPDGNLVGNANEQEAIRLMRQLRDEGKSFREIASILDGKGIMPKRGTAWLFTSIKGILARSAA
jgi:DNA invertase Pin-like site-specific DNA recombinase